METLISDSSQSIHGQASGALAKQHWIDGDIIHRRSLSKVVHKASSGEQVNGREISIASRIVMVAVDDEGREADVIIGVLIVDSAKFGWEVDGGVREQFHGTRPIAKTIVTH